MTHEEYQDAASLWERRDAAGVKAPKEYIEKKVDEFLSSHNTCALATACEGFVRCTPIEYLWKDGCVWLYSEGGKKFSALEKNTGVALALYDNYTGFASVHGMQISGTAVILDESSSLYEEMLEIRHLSREKLQKMGCPMHIIKVQPGRIDILMSEFKKDGYATRQFIEF